MLFLPCDINAAASRCAPVPQSKTSSSPPDVVSSTQDVLPPKWIVSGPGVAIEPRVPQKRILMRWVLLARGIVGSTRNRAGSVALPDVSPVAHRQRAQ